MTRLSHIEENKTDFGEAEENSQSGEWFYDNIEDALKTQLSEVLGANFEPVRALFEDIGWSNRLITVSNRTFIC